MSTAAAPDVQAERARLQAELDAEGRRFDAALAAWIEARDRLWPRIRALDCHAAAAGAATAGMEQAPLAGG
jgi:hypothetical protein